MAAENASADPRASASPAGYEERADTASRAGAWAERHPGRPRLRPASPRPPGKALIGAGLIGYAWVAGGTAPFSTKALLSVLLPGAVLGLIAYGRPPARIPPPESIDLGGMSYWLVCIALLFEWEASAFRDNSPPWHPSLTALINPLLAPHPVKSAAFAVWMLAGWALVRR